jgi:hypothetical protein
LQQIARAQLNLSDQIVKVYENHLKDGKCPQLAEYSKMLQDQIHAFSKVYVVVDALDECNENDGTRDCLLAELQKLQPTLHLLITSRPHVYNIEHMFEETASLDVLATNEDIKIYLNKRIQNEIKLKRIVKAYPDLKYCAG